MNRHSTQSIGAKTFPPNTAGAKKSSTSAAQMIIPCHKETFSIFLQFIYHKIWHWPPCIPESNPCKGTNEFLHRIVKTGIHRSPSIQESNQRIGTPFSSGFTIRSQDVTLREKNLQSVTDSKRKKLSFPEKVPLFIRLLKRDSASTCNELYKRGFAKILLQTRIS